MALDFEKLIAWVRDGPYRILILKRLGLKPEMPSILARSLNIHKSSVSRVLSDLRERNLIQEIPSGGRTKHYTLTTKGKDLLDEIKSREY